VIYGDSAYGTGANLAWLDQHGLAPMLTTQLPTAPGGPGSTPPAASPSRPSVRPITTQGHVSYSPRLPSGSARDGTPPWAGARRRRADRASQLGRDVNHMRRDRIKSQRPGLNGSVAAPMRPQIVDTSSAGDEGMAAQ
jgi:hypothetical protein